MKIVVIGGTGTIGAAVVAALQDEHDVVVVATKGGQLQADIASAESLRALYERVGKVDAVVSCAGRGAWKPLEQLTDADLAFSLGHKLMGQVNVVRYGIPHVRDGGSFTLTSGVLAREPEPGSAAFSLVNAGLDGFVGAAALELPRGLRVNVVSPPWISETLQAMGSDPSRGLPAATVARACVAAVGGTATGQVLDARAYA